MIEKENIKKIYRNGILNGSIKEIKILGSSMLPTISSGTVLKITNDFVIKINDIVVTDKKDRSIFVVHRIKEIDDKEEKVCICGDNEDISKSEWVEKSQIIAKVVDIPTYHLPIKDFNIIVDLPFSAPSAFNSKTYEIYQSITTKSKNTSYFDFNLDYNLKMYGEKNIRNFYSSNKLQESDYKVFSQKLTLYRNVAVSKYKVYKSSYSHMTLCNPYDEKSIYETINNYKQSPFYDFYVSQLNDVKQSILNDIDILNNVAIFVSVDDFNKLISAIIFSQVLYEMFNILPVLIDNSQLFNSKYNTTYINKYFKEIIPSYLLNKDIDALNTEYNNLNFSKYVSKEKIAKIRIMRECYYKQCLFCDRHGNDNFCFPINNILQKIKNLNKLGVNNIVFEDDCLVPIQVEKLINLLNENKTQIQWKGTFRFEEYLNNEKLIKFFADNGCKMLFFGMESFSQSHLDRMKKGIKVDTAINILKLCKKYNILTSISLLFGFPDETTKDLLITYEHLRNNINIIDNIELNYFMPTKNCKIIENDNEINYFKEQNKISDEKMEVIKKINSFVITNYKNSFYIKDYLCWQ